MKATEIFIKRPEVNTLVITERETTFLSLICTEMTYKEIADKMHVSPRTVENYRNQLFIKLGIKNRTGLVLFSIRNNIFQLQKAS
jgi:DNA-binding CsgD family transcriptional regulator